MSDQLMSIGCPHCGSVLSIRYHEGIESKSVTCPVCKQKSKISSCRRIEANRDNEDDAATRYPDPSPEDINKKWDSYSGGQPTGSPTPAGPPPVPGIRAAGKQMPNPVPRPSEDGITTISQPYNPSSPGTLSCPATGQFNLRLNRGRNIIGRKAERDLATIPLFTHQKRISRDHILIDVRQEADGTFIHLVSLAKSEVNPTYVNAVQLLPGDCVKLKNNDVIHLPEHIDLIFKS